MNKELVVARFGEDLHWLQSLRGWKITVYNKGEPVAPDFLPGGCAQIALENWGREAGTYLHHIVERYDRLAPLTAFVQGWPFDHNPEAVTELNLGLFGRPFSFFSIHAHGGGLREYGSVIECQRDGSPQHGGLAIPQMADRHGIARAGDGWSFSPGAQFVVSREAIRSHPREFYSSLLEEGRDPSFGYILERLWLSIFESGPVDAGASE